MHYRGEGTSGADKQREGDCEASGEGFAVVLALGLPLVAGAMMRDLVSSIEVAYCEEDRYRP